MNGLDKVIEHLNHAHLDALLNPPTDDMILEHLKKEMGHTLSWEHRGITHTVMGNIPYDEIMKIAEGIR